MLNLTFAAAAPFFSFIVRISGSSVSLRRNSLMQHNGYMLRQWVFGWIHHVKTTLRVLNIVDAASEMHIEIQNLIVRRWDRWKTMTGICWRPGSGLLQPSHSCSISLAALSEMASLQLLAIDRSVTQCFIRCSWLRYVARIAAWMLCPCSLHSFVASRLSWNSYSMQ